MIKTKSKSFQDFVNFLRTFHNESKAWGHDRNPITYRYLMRLPSRSERRKVVESTWYRQACDALQGLIGEAGSSVTVGKYLRAITEQP